MLAYFKDSESKIKVTEILLDKLVLKEYWFFFFFFLHVNDTSVRLKEKQQNS